MYTNYYVSEYSQTQWRALIDKATELGCQITYSKYGTHAVIDSTNREDQILASTGRGEQDRHVWAEQIHKMIYEAAERAPLTEVMRRINEIAGQEALWSGARSLIARGKSLRKIQLQSLCKSYGLTVETVKTGVYKIKTAW